MKHLTSVERRLQDLEDAFQNMERHGEIVDVKFDADRKRWFVKINDGEDKTPSGQDSQSEAAKRTFKSDWLPWRSFSHGSIKVSMPPKKGMKASLRSPFGKPEMAVAEPSTYGPETPSPHDKEDEVVMTIEGEDGKEMLRVHQSKGNHTVTIGDTVLSIENGKVSAVTKDYSVKCETFNLEADLFVAKTGRVDWSNG